MHLVCATHGYCFDGLASAVVFTRLLRAVRPDIKVSYLACGYGPNQQKPTESRMSGDENAILDYRYHNVPRLTWYFDHHRTAFESAADEASFRTHQREAPARFAFDAERTSCTQLIAEVAREHYGLELPELKELVDRADAVDSARFPSAEAASDVSSPVMQLVSVVEHYGGDKLLAELVPALLEHPLEQVARGSVVTRKYKHLRPRHQRFLERVRQRGSMRGRVVLVDLTEQSTDAITKFATYALYPKAVYSVVVSLLSGAVKISVGYNPWCGVERDRDISRICARFGGGGHPVVGGISFLRSDLERARSIAVEIADELSL